MQNTLIAAGVFAVSGLGMGPQNLIHVAQEEGQPVRIEVTPPPGHDNPTSRLTDGDARTSHFAKSQLKFAAGAKPTVTIDLRAPRLVTGLELGYAGEMRLEGIDRRKRGTWEALSPDLLDVRAAEHPKTSWWMARNLSFSAEGLRVRFHVGAEGGQLTELRVWGEPNDHGRRLGHLATMPRLPVAHQPATVMLDLRNPRKGAERTIRARCRLIDEQGKELVVAEPVSREVPPLCGVTVHIPMTMPGPGRYKIVARADGEKQADASETVYVLSRELQFIWYGVPEQARWVTMLTTVSQQQEIERWRRRGVVALGWSGGYCYRDKYDEEGFAHYWIERLERHPVGTAVDEFGNHAGKPTDRQMANGLLRAHRALPKKSIVIWQAGLTPPEAADAYRIAADWIIPECYMNYFNNRFAHFDTRIELLRDLGLIHKCVMGLSCTSDKIGTTAAGLEQQVRYVRRKAPEMPGLGFYKAYGTGAALVPVADRLCYEYFIKPTILAERCPRKPGRVLLRNIGSLPASDVETVFEKYQRGSSKAVQSDQVEHLKPDEVADVRLDTNRHGEGWFIFRVKSSEAYSVVSPALTIEVRAE